MKFNHLLILIFSAFAMNTYSFADTETKGARLTPLGQKAEYIIHMQVSIKYASVVKKGIIFCQSVDSKTCSSEGVFVGDGEIAVVDDWMINRYRDCMDLSDSLYEAKEWNQRLIQVCSREVTDEEGTARYEADNSPLGFLRMESHEKNENIVYERISEIKITKITEQSHIEHLMRLAIR